MRNCIILGSGRSGTSMIAGTLAGAGYFMGDELYPPRGSNPKGFFEGPQINGINEALLAQVVPTDQALGYGQRWLADLRSSIELEVTKEIEQAILYMINRKPYCFKDPRFSYTLPAWEPFFQSTTCICIFREPEITAESIVKECAQENYLANVQMTPDRALGIWTSIYNSILRLKRNIGDDWIFVHYAQVLSGEGLDILSQRLEVPVDHSFPDASLHRSQPVYLPSADTRSLYEKLCQLSGYTDPDGISR